MKKSLFLIVLGSLLFLSAKSQTLLDTLNRERLLKPLYLSTKHHTSDTARQDQQNIQYRPDLWYNTYLHKGDTIEQGMPGPGFYFTTKNNHIVHDSAFTFSASLQIKKGAHPTYRGKVRLCVVTADSIPVAIGKALANKIKDGTRELFGGAWQFFIQDTNKLTPLQEIPLKK